MEKGRDTQLKSNFFTQDPLVCAQALLGCTLHHKECSGLVVETEAYRAVGDEACHTFFKRNARTFVDVNDAGGCYVYLNYGVHWLLNFLTRTAEDEEGFVLVRAVDPISGLALMHQRRTKKKKLKDTDLCSGPGKLTQAFGIGPEYHETDLGSSESEVYFTERDSQPEIIAGPRIGITKAADLPWRYGVKGNRHISHPFPQS